MSFLRDKLKIIIFFKLCSLYYLIGLVIVFGLKVEVYNLDYMISNEIYC